MDTFFRFLYEFLSQFFNGLKLIVMGFVKGFGKIFNFKAYVKIVDYISCFRTYCTWIIFFN